MPKPHCPAEVSPVPILFSSAVECQKYLRGRGECETGKTDGQRVKLSVLQQTKKVAEACPPVLTSVRATNLCLLNSRNQETESLRIS